MIAQDQSPGGGSASPLSTEGDVYFRNSSADARLPVGTKWQSLTVNKGGTQPEWGTNPMFGVGTARRSVWWVCGGGSAPLLLGDVLNSVGTNCASAVSTTTQIGSLSNSGAATGNDFGWNGNLIYDFTRALRFVCIFKLSSIAATRAFIGIANQTLVTMVGGDNPAGDYAGIQFSTDRPDTNWQCVTKDTTTQGITDSGIAASTNLVTFIMVWNPAVSVEFYVNGTLVTRTTNLPRAAAGGSRFILGGETRENVAKGVIVFQVYAEDTNP